MTTPSPSPLSSLSPTEYNIPVANGAGTIHVRSFAGSEPAFLLLHGFPDNSHIYDRIIPHLSAAGRRSIAIDFLGFGASSKPSKPSTYSFPQQLNDVEAVVEHLNLSQVIPVGHDAGGPAAINFALRHPERTARVVMLNSFYGGDAPGLLVPEIVDFFSLPRFAPLHKYILSSPPQYFAWLFGFQRAELQHGLSPANQQLYTDFLGSLIDENFKQQPSALPAFAAMTARLQGELAANATRLAELRKSSVEFTFVWGKFDPYLHVSVAEYMRAQMQRASMHVLEAGHWPQVDAAEETAKIMVEAE